MEIPVGGLVTAGAWRVVVSTIMGVLVIPMVAAIAVGLIVWVLSFFVRAFGGRNGNKDLERSMERAISYSIRQGK